MGGILTLFATVILMAQPVIGEAREISCQVRQADLTRDPMDIAETRMIRHIGQGTVSTGAIVSLGTLLISHADWLALKESAGRSQAWLVTGIAGGAALVVAGALVYFYSEALTDYFYRSANPDGTKSMTPSERIAVTQALRCLAEELDKKEQGVKAEGKGLER